MTTVGFIGLGIMGAPMAAHLVRAGYDVRGFDLSAEALDTLAGQGGTAAASIADAVDGADTIVTMLPADPHVEAVMFGSDGVIEHAAKGALVIDMSTVRPGTAQKVAEQGAKRGLRVLDAPVSGGQAGAVEGVLSIMVGGESADAAAADEMFRAFGKTIVHVGPHGAGQAVKAANQLLVGGIIALNAEALVLMEATGVDVKAGLTALAGGLAGSTVLDRKMANFLERSYPPGFRIDLHHKDMGIIIEAAREAGVALPLTGTVAQLVAAARAAGLGGSDHSALLAVVDGFNGRSTDQSEQEA